MSRTNTTSPGLLESTLSKFSVDPSKGLTFEQVFVRKQQYGPNELGHDGLDSNGKSGFLGKLKEDYGELVGQYLEQFQNPLILLLIGSAAISLLLSQFENAISIALV